MAGEAEVSAKAFNHSLGRVPFKGMLARWFALSVFIGLVFVYSGVIKILDPIGFAGDIENYHLVPWPIGVRLAFYLPWLELLCGIALITPWLRRGALTIVAILMVVFIAASVIAKMRGLDVSCGCFGHAARGLSFAGHLAIDVGILAAIAALMSRARPSLR